MKRRNRLLFATPQPFLVMAVTRAPRKLCWESFTARSFSTAREIVKNNAASFERVTLIWTTGKSAADAMAGGEIKGVEIEV